MKKLLILCLTFMIAAELEVDGNLKVIGNVDVQNNPIKNVGPPTDMNDAINAQILQDALRDDGPFEYKIYQIAWYRSNWSNNSGTDIFYRKMDVGDSFTYTDFTSHYNELSGEGWIMDTILAQEGTLLVNGNTSVVYTVVFKRSLEDSE